MLRSKSSGGSGWLVQQILCWLSCLNQSYNLAFIHPLPRSCVNSTPIPTHPIQSLYVSLAVQLISCLNFTCSSQIVMEKLNIHSCPRPPRSHRTIFSSWVKWNRKQMLLLFVYSLTTTSNGITPILYHTIWLCGSAQSTSSLLTIWLRPALAIHVRNPYLANGAPTVHHGILLKCSNLQRLVLITAEMSIRLFTQSGLHLGKGYSSWENLVSR